MRETGETMTVLDESPKSAAFFFANVTSVGSGMINFESARSDVESTGRETKRERNVDFILIKAADSA